MHSTIEILTTFNVLHYSMQADIQLKTLSCNVTLIKGHTSSLLLLIALDARDDVEFAGHSHQY